MCATGKYHSEWGNPITKEHTWYALTDKWILTQNLGISKTQLTDKMNLKNMEEQSMDTLSFLEGGTKYLQEEIQCEAESEGKTIQRLPHLEIHPIYSYKSQTLLWMPTSTCWPEPDIAVTWEALLVHDKYRGGHSHPAIDLSTGSPMEELEKGPKELNGFAAP